MEVHLINPSHVSFGTAVITPRWQYVLAAATPKSFGDPILVDETLFQMNPGRIQQGDAVGIGIHTANALRGYEIGKMARKRSAYVIFGGIHATLYPEEALELGGAHAVVKGDGDIVWAKALADCREGAPKPVYAGGQIEASDFVAARWDLVPRNRWEKTLGASPPTIAGIPLTRRWLIPQALRPKLYWSHPIMSAEEIRSRTQAVWDSFYSFGSILLLTT